MDYWTQFAAAANPNNAGRLFVAQHVTGQVDLLNSRNLADVPSWPAYTLSNDANLNLDEQITVTSGLKKNLCDFWDSIMQ